MVAKRLFLLGLLAFLCLPQGVTAQAKFYETVLVVDEPEDFAQPALDLSGVYAKEVYPYDSILQSARDLIVIRVQPQNLDGSSSCLVYAAQFTTQVCSMRYDVHFEANGQPQSLFVQFGPQAGNPRCCPIEDQKGEVRFDQNSALFFLDREALGLAAGTQITKLYATSELVKGDQRQKGDRAPGDNENLPYDQKPELASEFAPPYVVRGTYEFFTVEVVDGLVRNSIGGQQVKFSFKIAPTAGVVDDTVRVRFDRHAGWSVTPSRGTTGADPTGLITGISAGTSVPFDFSIAANDIVEEGDLAPIGVHFHSASEGHVFMVATVRVTGNVVEDPNYVFRLQDSGPFRAGEAAVIRFDLVDAQGQARVGLPIDVAFLRDGRRVATLAATPVEGAYEAAYEFPSGGMWTIDASVRGLAPAPHAAFAVRVEDGGNAPGLAGPLLLGTLVAVAVASRRRA
ncbi:MAG: hypothetical protein HYT80_04560 [Euryarchaeota archaeon]|nr:hypothetical protein [Euryarchaeota archaeon]